MTSEARAALREKVAEELWQAESVRAVGTRRNIPWSEAGPAARHQWLPLADAAIAVVLEEAARVAYQEWLDGTPPPEIAAAIRGMKGQ
jgi:hypothetical protein